MRRCYSSGCGRGGPACYSPSCIIADTVADRARRTAKAALMANNPAAATAASYMAHIQQLAMRGAFGNIAHEFEAPPQRYSPLRNMAGHLVAEKVAEPFAFKYSMLQLLLFAQLGIAISRDNETRPRRFSTHSSHSSLPQRAAPLAPGRTRDALGSESSYSSMERADLTGADFAREDAEEGVEDLLFFNADGTMSAVVESEGGKTPERTTVKKVRRKNARDEYAAMGMTAAEAAILREKMRQMQSVLEEELKELEQQEADLFTAKIKELQLQQEALKLEDFEEYEEEEIG